MTRKKILIADDDRAFVTALALRCQRLGADVRTACDGTRALAMIRQERPDLILLDVAMPGEDGLKICQILAAEQHTDQVIPPTPVIMITGKSDPATLRRCEELGAPYFLKTPDLWGRLEQTVRELLGAQDAASPPVEATTGPPDSSLPTVLCVDDDPALTQALKIRLRPYGVTALAAHTGMQGFWMALKHKPDAIILDIGMPDGSGQYVLGRLKAHPLTSEIPVIVLTGHVVSGRKDYGLERDVLNLGASCLLIKPLYFDELLAQLRNRLPLSATLPPSRPVQRLLQSTVNA